LPDDFYFDEGIKSIAYMFKNSGLITTDNLIKDFILPRSIESNGANRNI
jgi:hypothetical protein